MFGLIEDDWIVTFLFFIQLLHNVILVDEHEGNSASCRNVVEKGEIF